jgi:hypothetical protein
MMTAQSITVTNMNGLGRASSLEEANRAMRYKVIGEHLFSELNNEAVVLSLKNGKYYGLNNVGVSIFQALQSPKSLGELKTEIMAEYSVDETVCETELKSFLQTMEKEGLIEVFDDEAE